MAGPHMLETASERRFDISGAKQSPRGVEAQQLFDRTADDDHSRRIVEELEIAHVPRDEAQLGVDDADPLRQMLERRTQQLAVELDDVRCFVEQPHDFLELHVATAQHRCHDKTRA